MFSEMCLNYLEAHLHLTELRMLSVKLLVI